MYPDLGLQSVHCRSIPPPQLIRLKDILTIYQPSPRLEITLHGLMPTPVKLSKVGQPFIEGDYRMHVIEVPFRLWGAHRKAITLRHISQIHNSHLFSGRATLAIFQTLVYALHFIHLTDLQNSGFTIFCIQGEPIAASSMLLVPQLFCRMVGILTLKSTPVLLVYEF